MRNLGELVLVVLAVLGCCSCSHARIATPEAELADLSATFFVIGESHGMLEGATVMRLRKDGHEVVLGTTNDLGSFVAPPGSLIGGTWVIFCYEDAYECSALRVLERFPGGRPVTAYERVLVTLALRRIS